MQRQRLIIIIGVILGLLAVFLVKVYLDQQRKIISVQEKRRVQKMQENMVPVLMAKKDIAKGAEVNPDDLEVSLTPKDYMQPQAVTSLDRISGMKTIVPIKKGEQITLGKLMWPKQAAQEAVSSGAGSSLAMTTPVGKRAVTIAVDNIASLAGMVKAGDYVDVLSVILIPVPTQDGKHIAQPTIIPLFQNVLLLAVGRDIGGRPPQSSSPEAANRYSQPEKQSSGGANLITLALSPEEANIVAFVQEQGKFRLVLRSPADSQIQQTQPTTWDTFFKYALPSLQAKPGETTEAVEKKKEEYVEVYRGLNKELMPLSE